jgi:hypothetical protein
MGACPLLRTLSAQRESAELASPDAKWSVHGLDALPLEPDSDPDRVRLRCVAGVVYKSRSYAPGHSSSAAWQREERERCMAALNRVVQSAERELEQLGP